MEHTSTNSGQNIRRWLTSLQRIDDEITKLHSNRQIWQYLNQELPKHGGGLVHQTITRWYIDSQAAGVRRVASNRSQDGNSLYKLLLSIDAHIDEFDGERWGEPMTHEAVQQDLKTLLQTAALVSKWTDENVAHMGRVQSANPTFNDLDRAIGTFGKLLVRYTLVLTGASTADVTPEIQEDWKQPFRHPWV